MDGEWRVGASEAQEFTTRRRRAIEIAGRQHELISTAQLQMLGFAGSSIRSAVGTSRLHRTLFTGVYSLTPPPLDRRQTIQAAVLACGHRSLASHWSAAEVLTVADPPLLPVHVTVPGQNRSRRHLVVHRSPVPACDTSGRDGILCTSAARTIVDLAAVATPEELERILIAADSLRIVNHRRLEELAATGRGTKALRALLADDPIVVRSGTETQLLQAFRRVGIPEPVVNGVVEDCEVDYHWPDLRLIVELDGWRFHGGRERMNADRSRDQRLALAGWRVVRFTRDQVVADADGCGRRLAAIAATCSGR